jgi:hypothetical protein
MKTHAAGKEAKIETFNQLLNLCWTVISFLPVLFYWLSRKPDIWLYTFIILSLLFGMLPKKFYKQLQPSSNLKFYKKYGVLTIRRFVQNGDLINHFFRQKSPHYKVINDLRQIKGYLETIAMYERYHFMCFMFFLSTSILSLMEQKPVLAILITLSNIIYNVCPIFLQQYNRLRIERLTNNNH